MDVNLNAATRTAIVALSLAEAVKLCVQNQLLVSEEFHPITADRIKALEEITSNHRKLIGTYAGVARVMIESLIIDRDQAVKSFQDEIAVYRKALENPNEKLDLDAQILANIVSLTFTEFENLVVGMLTDTKSFNFIISELPVDVSAIFKEKS